MKILYLEDDPGLARLLKKGLQRKGYEVDVAEDGDAGIAMARAVAYDAILVDYNLPGRCGLDVIRHLGEAGSFPPTIMLTGNGNEKVAVEALKLGATDYIVKDVDLGYLEVVPMILEQVLYKQRLVVERELMFQVIRENEERYRRLVELSPDGIGVITDGVVDFVNPAGTSLLGADSAIRLLGRRVTDFVHPDNRSLFESHLKLIGQGGENVPWVEERFLRLDGSTLQVEVSGIPFTQQGKPAVQIIFRDITERKIAKERLEQLAHFDPLTGLPNRTLFFDRLSQAYLQAQRYSYMFALLFIDLDGFKGVNDTLGHDAGDLVLKEAGRRLSTHVRNCDTVARMGGDEFTVILSRITTKGDAMAVAEQLVAEMSKPFDVEGTVQQLGASIGIAIFPDDGADAQTLLKAADIAMYDAKASGKNGYRFHHVDESCCARSSAALSS